MGGIDGIESVAGFSFVDGGIDLDLLASSTRLYLSKSPRIHGDRFFSEFDIHEKRSDTERRNSFLFLCVTGCGDCDCCGCDDDEENECMSISGVDDRLSNICVSTVCMRERSCGEGSISGMGPRSTNSFILTG
jgi:hypothetical protein